MSLASAVLIEPYLDPIMGVMFAICYDEGTIEFCENWRDKFSEQERKELEGLANRSQIWKLPPKPDTKKFLEIWSGYETRIQEDNEHQEARKEYMINVLSDIYKRICRYLKKFCYFDDDRIYDLMCAQILHSYFRDQFNVSPILTFDGVSGAGKSSALRAMKLISYRAHLPSSYSAASLVDAVYEDKVTLLLDESFRNLSTDRGTDIKGLLISGFNRDTAIYTRKNLKTNKSEVKNHFTTVSMTTLEDLSDDLRNRSMVVTMSLPDESFTSGELDYIDDLDLDVNIHPDSIRADLFALKIITESERGKGSERRAGIWFDEFRAITKRHITNEENGRYLYGVANDITYTPRLSGRDFNMAMVYYTIGQTFMSEGAIIGLIIENSRNVMTHRTDTTESVLMKAFADMIKERHDAKYSGITAEGILAKELIIVADKITMPEIHARYRSIRTTLQGWDMKEVESPRTLTMTFRKLRIPYEERGGRTNFIKATDPNFITQFKKAAKQYLDPETFDFFKGI